MITVAAFSHADWFITWTINICALRAVGKAFCVCVYTYIAPIVCFMHCFPVDYAFCKGIYLHLFPVEFRSMIGSSRAAVQGDGWSIWNKAWEPFTRLLQKLWSALGTQAQNAREELPSGFAGWPASGGSVLIGARPLSQLWGAILQEPGHWLQGLQEFSCSDLCGAGLDGGHCQLPPSSGTCRENK